MPTVVQRRKVPEAIRSLSTLESPDYVDLFIATANGATDKTPERWARATVEGVHPWARFIAWRVLCGLRLERGRRRTTLPGGGSPIAATTGASTEADAEWMAT